MEDQYGAVRGPQWKPEGSPSSTASAVLVALILEYYYIRLFLHFTYILWVTGVTIFSGA